MDGGAADHDAPVHRDGGDREGGDHHEDGLQRVQYCTLQYSTVQYSTVQYSTVQYTPIQGLFYHYKRRTKKEVITVKFNNPTFHLSSSSSSSSGQEPGPAPPIYTDRTNHGSYIDLSPTV